ncbi:MAG: cell division protein SepF [Eubacteriales bacterium]|nr:cell division protein SepF [Eubacteriales bacterium]
MGFLDKILSTMKLNDDYDDDDFLDDEIDEYEESRPRKSLFKKSREEDLDDFDETDDEPVISRKVSKQPVKSVKSTVSKTKPAAAPSSSKVSPIRSRKGNNDMAVCVVKPKNMEDAREITETLLANCTVVLNMEGLDLDLAQRIIDFTSGSCYAISGNLQKISNYIFIITPAAVDISGDFQDILSGAFDVPPMNFRY